MKPELRALLKIIANIFVMLAIVFGISGDIYWKEGWIFYILFTLMIAAMTIPMMKNKKLLEERMRSPIQKEQQKADKIIMLIFLPQLYGWLVILPLEHRFMWTEKFPTLWIFAGIIGFIVSILILYLVIKKNSHLYVVVKSKKDQKVISDGIYGIVRHPMYMSIVLLVFSGALLTSSNIGLILALTSSITLYIRTIFEERLLEKELKGYKEYKKKVTKKLIPFLI